MNDQPRGKRQRSLVLVNTADGKGKPTAAFGAGMRAVARDWNVRMLKHAFVRGVKARRGIDF